MDETCSSCRYWNSGSTPNIDDRGECRFNPPTVVITKLDESRDVSDEHPVGDPLTKRERTRYKWPFTQGADWCGQFKSR